MNDMLLYVKNVSWSLSSLLVYGRSNYMFFQDSKSKEHLSKESWTIYVWGGMERQVTTENTSCVLCPFSDLEKHVFSLSIVTRISIFLLIFVCLFCFVLKAWLLQEGIAVHFEHCISKWRRAHPFFYCKIVQSPIVFSYSGAAQKNIPLKYNSCYSGGGAEQSWGWILNSPREFFPFEHEAVCIPVQTGCCFYSLKDEE